ncbi:hypothetical protein DAEQUDRAFT_461514 [Daedalea quercina L-15889]|uniref:Uncharacterized protein n=1 Tax=Daedalea quercina L-15889 TaxID=1314783 RepID=A0A165TD12_9APHY|nr:hypothetical protein DAEQUDRAFT_461514 [Daedalea quercina L-15889]
MQRTTLTTSYHRQTKFKLREQRICSVFHCQICVQRIQRVGRRVPTDHFASPGYRIRGHFNSVCQGSKGTLEAERISPNVLDEQHAVTVRVDSPGRLRRNLGADNLIGMIAQPVPSVMLTFPTLQLPASSVFVPQSPITVSKFITAAESSSNLVTTARKLVPSVQFCPDCAFVPPDSGFLRYSCDRQWLACKV